MQKGRNGIQSELFDTQNREIFIATCHFEKEKKNVCLKSYTVKTKSKGKKNDVVLSTSRLSHDKTIDDGKEKPQIIKFYGFTKGVTDIVNQLNDYYTTRSRSCRWVMLALSRICWIQLESMGKPCSVWKVIQIFQAHLHMA